MAVVVDATKVRFYLDGLKMSEAGRANNTISISGAKSWRFSSRPNGSYTAIAGGLDEVRLAADAWSDSAIVAQVVVGGEVCDGADTNCDGTSDEGYATSAAACDGPDVGQCESGVGTICTPSGHVACSGDTSSYHFALDSKYQQSVLGGTAERWLHAGGATIGTGKRDSAVQLDGSWPLMHPLQPGQSRTATGTFATWVYFSGGTGGHLMHWKSKSGATIFLVERAASKLRVQTPGGSQTFDATALANDVWVHVAVVASAGQVTAYLDGVEVGNYADNSLSKVYGLDGLWTVGGSLVNGAAVSGLTGKLDDLVLLDPSIYSPNGTREFGNAWRRL